MSDWIPITGCPPPSSAVPVTSDGVQSYDSIILNGWTASSGCSAPATAAFVPEAPNDGKLYGRQSENWSPVSTPSLINVQDFSILPNGVDCYSALQSLLNTVISTGQGLYFPQASGANYYFIDGASHGNVPLQIPAKAAVIGSGWGGTLVKYTGDVCFDIIGPNIWVSGFTIDGSLSVAGGNMIATAIRFRIDLATVFQYVLISEMYTTGNITALSDSPPAGVTLTKSSNTITLRNWQDKTAVGYNANSFDQRHIGGSIEFHNVHANTASGLVETGNRWHFYLVGPGGFYLTNCACKGTFDGVHPQGGQGGVYFQGGQAVWLENLNIENMGGKGYEADGVYFLRAFGTHIGQCDLDAMTIGTANTTPPPGGTSSFGADIHEYHATDIVGNASSAGSTATSNGIVGNGPSPGSQYSQFVNFFGLHINGVAQDGINLGARCDNWRISGLDVRDRGSGGCGRDGIRSAGTNVIVHDSRISDCHGYCLNPTAGSGVWGIDSVMINNLSGGYYPTPLPAGWRFNTTYMSNIGGPLSLGTITSNIIVTIDPTQATQQTITNNSSAGLRLAPGTNFGSCVVDVTNGTTPGVIGTSAFTKVVGSFPTMAAGQTFRLNVSVGQAGSLLQIQEIT